MGQIVNTAYQEHGVFSIFYCYIELCLQHYMVKIPKQPVQTLSLVLEFSGQCVWSLCLL